VCICDGVDLKVGMIIYVERLVVGRICFFWTDRWLGDLSMRERFKGLFELVENKWLTVAYMFALGWGECGEA